MSIFTHTPNECVTATDGRKFFISRSVAVIPQVYCWIKGEKLYILVNERGPDCPDHVGEWALPCGYLDWDESGGEAAREIFEECDFDIASPPAGLTRWFSLDLWDVITEPKEDGRQNILLHYTTSFVAQELPIITKVPDGETSQVRWMPVEEALQIQFAFGHQYNIYDCLNWQHKNNKILYAARSGWDALDAKVPANVRQQCNLRKTKRRLSF